MPRDTYLPLKPRPGVWRNGSAVEAIGRWYDVNLVRWTNGRLRPVGGWQRFASAPLSAAPRGLHGWRANNQSRWLSIGTANQLLLHDNTEQKDVTPLGFAVGRSNSVYGLGWGSGLYGKEAYGTARQGATSIILDAATWSFDNFGEVLLGCCTGDGRIYEWLPAQWAQAGEQLKAKAITTAPIGVSFVFVTDERHVVALGADGNPRMVKWSSRENRAQWTANALTTAGEKEVASSGKLLSAVKWRGETLLFTDCDIHSMKFVGTPFVYGIEQVSDNNGIVGPQAAISTSERALWMSTNGFYEYDGVARKLVCDVQEYVFNDINMLQGAKIVAAHNGDFSEVWWFYPSKDSVENDRYVIWNYAENWWSFGVMARTAWMDKSVWQHVVAADPDGYLYQHEQGWTNAGATRVGQVYAESGAIQIGNGEKFAEVVQLIPDDCEDEDCVAFSFKLRETPRAEPFAVAGPFTFSPSGYCDDARFSARQINMRVEATKDADFHIGTLRADVKEGSGR